MSATPPNATPAISSALSAFLRGIERRAYVFALVQCGNDRDAGVALGRAIHAFHTVASLGPLSSWPGGFWSLLMAQPELSRGGSGVPELVTLSSGPRAALLLRLVAGLDFPHAAQVLGVTEETYRFALNRALQQLGDAGVSYATLRTLRERLHRQVKTLPADTTRALSDLRERALLAAPVDAAAARRVPPPPWLARTLWALLALLALAFAATFVDFGPTLAPNTTEGLPAEAVAPVPGAPSPSDVVMHPDYAQLASPDDERYADDLALLSWLANHPEEFVEADAEAAEADTPAPEATTPAPVPEAADAR